MLYCIPFNVSLEMSSFETVAEFVLIVVPALTALFGYPIALTVLELFFLGFAGRTVHLHTGASIRRAYADFRRSVYRSICGSWAAAT